MARIPGRRRSRPLTGCFAMTLHSYCAPISSLSDSNRHFRRRCWRPAGGELWITCGPQGRHDPMRWPSETVRTTNRAGPRATQGLTIRETTRPSVGCDGPDDHRLDLTYADRGDRRPPERGAASRRPASRRLGAPRAQSLPRRRAEIGRRAGVATTKDASRNHEGNFEAPASPTRKPSGAGTPTPDGAHLCP